MRVQVRALAKRFAAADVLADLDLDLEPGRIVAVIGLNGAGKTTLLRSLAAVLTPTRGEVLWDGEPGLRDDSDRHRRIMFLPDEPLLIPEHTVVEHLALQLRAWGREEVPDEAVVAVLRELDLLDRATVRVGALSRGQRYKTSLAALLLIRPELWLLDEPFASGMDPQGMQALRREARAAAADGATVVYTTQILEIAERFSDRLLVLADGRLRADLSRAALDALPAEGPGSICERLAGLRDSR